MSLSPRSIRIGTRGSALALEQARRVADAFANLPVPIAIETRIITTAGDRDKQTPLAVLGGQGVFAKELEAALLAGEIDLAVHSAKDLPSQLPAGLRLVATLPREDPSDVLVSRSGARLDALPAGARIGTSSRRRAVQLRTVRPDLEAVELRGNLDSRLRKVSHGQVDAAILAAAGILRMGWNDRITEFLPLDRFVPAPGQGAIGLECRADDSEMIQFAGLIDDPTTHTAVAAERAFLAQIGAGCRSPVGAHATLEHDRLRLQAMLADERLTVALYRSGEASATESAVMARRLADELKLLVDQRLAATRR